MKYEIIENKKTNEFRVQVTKKGYAPYMDGIWYSSFEQAKNYLDFIREEYNKPDPTYRTVYSEEV